MSNTTNMISVNVPIETKVRASEIFNDLGLNMSTAINMFLVQVVKKRGIPFEITSDAEIPELSRITVSSTEDIRKKLAETNELAKLTTERYTLEEVMDRMEKRVRDAL